MERSEEELETMCRRLVRFAETNLRRKDPDISLNLTITEYWDCFAGEIVQTSREGTSIYRYGSSWRNLGKSHLYVTFIYSLSISENLLDISQNDDFEIVLNPGMFEELDLKLSSMGF